MERILLEFTRADHADDPYAFRFGTQAYLLHTAGGGVRSTTLTWDDELLGALDKLRADPCEPATVQQLGNRLRHFLTPTHFETHERIIAHAVEHNQPVYITIRSAAAELYALPWELLTIGNTGQHLGELPQVLVRYCWPETETAAAQSQLPEGGRILFAWSAAGGAVPARDHQQAIAHACRRGNHDFDTGRDVLSDASLERLEMTLAEAMRRGEPVRVLHLLAHGAESGDSFGLCWDRNDCPRAIIDAARLRQLLGPYAEHLRLVVLCACDSGNLGAFGNHLGSLAQNIHRVGVESVVASRLPLSIQGSVVFTTHLYGRLLGRPSALEDAYLRARRALARDTGNLDWASVQLYARPEDGDDTRPFTFRPYRGLLPFQRQHTRFFFGRSAERNEIIGDLEALEAAGHPRLLIVTGASGTGKSSVVMAGAIPEMTRESDLDLLETRSGIKGDTGADDDALDVAHALRTLNLLETHLPGEETRASVDTLRRLLADAEMSAQTAWEVTVMRIEADPMQMLERALRRRRDPTRHYLLVIDQFEELFTSVTDEALRKRFVRRLWSVCREPNRVSCVVTLRVDFLGACGDLVVDETGLRLDKVAYDEAHRVFVAQMAHEDLRAAVEEPAELVGLVIEPGLVSTMLEDVGTEPGALPLLQYTLDLLWSRRQGRVLTLDNYHEIGGITGALERKADSIIDGFDEAESRQARRLLVRLVGVDDTVALDTRRRVAIATLRPTHPAENAAFDRVLDALAAARLLVRSDDGGTPVVEVAHEALIRKWDRLRQWLGEDRDMLGELQEVERWVEQWQQYGTLLEGDWLGYALRVQEKYPDSLQHSASEMLAASTAAEAAKKGRERRRQRILAAVAIGAALAAMIAAWQAVRAEQARDDAERAEVVATEQRDNAKTAEEAAKEAEQAAKKAKENAERERDNAENAREVAKQAQAEAERERDLAKHAHDKEEKARKAEKAALDIAEAKRREAEHQRTAAEEQKREAERQKAIAEKKEAHAKEQEEIAKRANERTRNLLREKELRIDKLEQQLAGRLIRRLPSPASSRDRGARPMPTPRVRSNQSAEREQKNDDPSRLP